jgi:proline iminopeptidase
MKIKSFVIVLAAVTFFSNCKEAPKTDTIKEHYLDFSQRDDQFTGGIKMIPITTPVGKFKVWTKTVGNNPKIKVLLLHGGPGGTHEFFESFDGYFPQESIEYIYYDQLGSYYSDQPDDNRLWTTERFVEEVEQVRQALHLDNTNFYLLGQSWGGILAIEYDGKCACL